MMGIGGTPAPRFEICNLRLETGCESDRNRESNRGCESQVTATAVDGTYVQIWGSGEVNQRKSAKKRPLNHESGCIKKGA